GIDAAGAAAGGEHHRRDRTGRSRPALRCRPVRAVPADPAAHRGDGDPVPGLRAGRGAPDPLWPLPVPCRYEPSAPPPAQPGPVEGHSLADLVSVYGGELVRITAAAGAVSAPGVHLLGGRTADRPAQHLRPAQVSLRPPPEGDQCPPSMTLGALARSGTGPCSGP